ncbi:hypothetical protein [Pontimicrobium aquaticum]|uniref:DUF3108 domain-containing protein n=1 Tax=Pontimicrobium aquaticum TaxID=2565367 RepID=A0A4V5LR46_9FLAO|nr:hypothetical protein [Pontimicrobium aquaticum]TJY37819.1 hypothetical protein E5167_00765 [Pontimicrobium aquaticum]
MYDSTNSKVGSMVFGTYFENGFFVARDTSLFDDGSVYETAEFKIDTTNLKMSQTRINFQFGKINSVNISLNNNENRITGDYIIKKDTITNSVKVDSVYKYNIYRGELFMLLNTIKIQKGDSLNLNIFVPMQLNTSKVLITGLGEEKIKVPYYDDMQLCDRIKIKADGVMPDNIIWITKTEPRRMLKVHVPNNKLDIELVDVK